jgi:hypothetical protein
MATYDLNRSELNGLLASDHIDPSVRSAIIHYLVDDGLLHSHDKVSMQEGGPLKPGTQVLLVTTPNASVNTSTDPSLKAIVDVSSGKLTVTGHDNVIVGAGPHVNLIDLSGTTGNDVVDAEGSNAARHGGGLFGDGGNYSTLWGGGGDDSWSGGRGGDWGRHDHGQGGGGNFETLGGGGHDGWFGGGGGPFGGGPFSGGPTWGDNEHYSTLRGGYGDDRDHRDRHDGRGDHHHDHREMGGGRGDDRHSHHEMGGSDTTTIIAGTGNDTLIGGQGNYLFEIGPHGGNDSIVGGSGNNNTVVFDDSPNDVRISNNCGVTTVTFGETHETVKLTGIQNIVFTDHGK